MTRAKSAMPHSARTMNISSRHSAKGQSASGEYSTTSKLKRAGGPLVSIVPCRCARHAGPHQGQEMVVSVKGRQVIAEPVSVAAKPIKVRQPKYTLDELLEGYESGVPHLAEEKAWAYAPPVGNEVW